MFLNTCSRPQIFLSFIFCWCRAVVGRIRTNDLIISSQVLHHRAETYRYAIKQMILCSSNLVIIAKIKFKIQKRFCRAPRNYPERNNPERNLPESGLA
jgi:hypothetical protein